MASNSSLQITGSPSSPFKRLRMGSNSAEKRQPELESFDDLAMMSPGGEYTLKAMVCRRWDVSNTTGKYIGTEFVLSDSTGNAIHCMARSSIAHCFTSKLEVGGIYSIRRFSVLPNREMYRIRRDDPNCIQLEGYSVVRKLNCPSTGFDQYPAVLQDIEDISLNGNRFCIDVVGCVVNMGSPRPTKNNSQLLSFELRNERGNSIKVTLWGALCDDLLRRARGAPEPFIILLVSLNIRAYKGEVFVSSSSATCIYDTDAIQAISQLRRRIEDAPIAAPDLDGQLIRLLQVGRELKGLNRAQSVTVHCEVTIVGIRNRNSWHYVSCGGANCRKGLQRVENSFWCESCDAVVEFPVPRFRLEMEVSDPTATVTVTVFDEIAETMVKKSAATLLQEHDDEDDNDIPDEVLQLINTTHVLEIKTHTYYDHGEFESFTASRLIRKLDAVEGQHPPAPDNAPAAEVAEAPDSIVPEAVANHEGSKTHVQDEKEGPAAFAPPPGTDNGNGKEIIEAEAAKTASQGTPSLEEEKVTAVKLGLK